jgi:transcriptional regulator with XRE-family HTH domain
MTKSPFKEGFMASEISLLMAQRHRLGLSQEAIARLIGVSFVTVNQWERGKQEPDSFQILNKIREVTRELSKKKTEEER